MPTQSKSEQQACDAVIAIGWVGSYDQLLKESVRIISSCLYCSEDRSLAMLHGMLGHRLIELEVCWPEAMPPGRCRWVNVRIGRR